MASKPRFNGEVVKLAKETASFADVLRDFSRGVTRIKQCDYRSSGRTLVVDQGQDSRKAYCDVAEGVFSDVPCIVFGDHTRCVKYIDEPFVAGADGVKILTPANEGDNVRYWYHALRVARIPSLGYSRHFKLVKALSFRIYERNMQDAIVEILDGILKQIESCNSFCRRLDQLAKSRFIEMFGDPVGGEPKFERCPICGLGRVTSGATPSRKRPDFYGGSIPWVKTGEVAKGAVYFTEECITEEALRGTSCHLLPAGTVLVAMYGQGDTRGKAAILNIEAATNQACAAIELNEKVCSSFVLAHLQLCYEDLRGLSHGGNQKNLNLRIIKDYPLILPPLSLQREFADFVRRVDKLEFVARQSIEKLQMLYDSLAQEYFSIEE